MEPVKIILLAIVVLGIILIALIVYLLASGSKGRSSKKRGTLEAPRSHDVRERLKSEREPPSHIPGMDTVNQRVERRPAEPLRPGRSTDVTPPSGIATGARAPQVDQDDRTPAGGTSVVQKSDDEHTAPQPQISPPKPTVAPPKPAPPKRPKRKRTVAMSSGFFTEEREAQQAKKEQAAAATQDAASKEPTPAAGRPRDTPVASSAAYTGSTAPRVSPTPRSAPAFEPPAPTSPAKPVPTSPAKPAPAPTPAPATPHDDDTPTATESVSAPAEDTHIEQFRDTSLPARTRIDAFNALLESTPQDEKVLYLVEGVNADLMELQLISLREITAQKDDALLDDVIPLVDSSEPDVALGAIKALKNIGGPVVEQTLLMALESNHASVREEASNALIENATPSLQAQLHEMLQDDDENSVEISAKLLGALGGPQNAELLDVRASLLPAESPLKTTVTSAATHAKTRDHSRATGSHDPFGGAEEITTDDGIEEFELSLDPELFNPKS